MPITRSPFAIALLPITSLVLAPLVACDDGPVEAVGPELASDICLTQTQEVGQGLVVGIGDCLLAFGERDLSVRHELNLLLVNAGPFDLTIDEVLFSADSDPGFEIVAFPAEIARDAAPVSVRIAYRPRLESNHRATLIIRSDAVNLEDQAVPGELHLTLTGSGVDNGVPDINLRPAECDFGRVAQGSVKECLLTVENLGDRDLVFDGVDLVGPAAADDLAVSTFGFFGRPPSANDVIGFTEGDNAVSIAIRCNPPALGVYEGVLTFRSNDPDEPEVAVPLRCVGVDPPTCNVGIISVNGIATTAGMAPTIEPLDDVVLTADMSEPSTASGNITGVKWEIIERPSGSTVVLTAPTGLSTGFTFADVLGVDLAGRYAVRVTVTDDLGIDSVNECDLAFEAIPTDSVLIQLSWDTSDGDMDLHLVKKNDDGEYCPQGVSVGNGALSSSSCSADRDGDDCYYGNCKATSSNRPDWDGDGVVASEGDPSLDIDDLDGFGPENINIDAAVASEYLVGVDYFSGSGTIGNTIRIYLYGQLQAEFFRELSGSGAAESFWEVAVVSWPDACVEDLNTAIAECG